MTALPKIAQRFSYKVPLEEGKKYSWCACGRSQTQPFCDGSHSGTEFSPIVFASDRTGIVGLCGCKISQGKPFCDGMHKTLPPESV